MTRLGALVLAPLPAPWWPPLDLGAPVLLPDLATLVRVLEGLRRL